MQSKLLNRTTTVDTADEPRGEAESMQVSMSAPSTTQRSNPVIAVLGDDTSPLLGTGRSVWIGSWSRALDTVAALLVLLAIVLYANAPMAGIELQDFLALRITLKNVLLIGAFLVAWPAALTVAGAYQITSVMSLRGVLSRIVTGCALGSVLVVAALITSETGILGTATVPIFLSGAVLGTLFVRLGTRFGAFVTRLRSEPRRVVIAGTGARAMSLWAEMRRHPFVKYELVAAADVPGLDGAETAFDKPLVTIDHLEAFLMRTIVDEVVVALPVRSCYQEIQQVLQICERAGVHSHYLVDAFSPTIARARVSSAGRYSVVAMHVVQDGWRLGVKRVFDVIVASLLLVLLAPVLLGIMLSIRLTSGSPVFFAQNRYGFRKRLFRMHKFRTMVTNAEQLQHTLEDRNEAEGPVFKIAKDPRITRLGAFLRRTSLDELPQLWNVIKGEMSMVGPRPLPVRDVTSFKKAWLMRRFSVQPGLTCLWQVSGRSKLTFDEWVHLDLQYIDEWSLGLDFRILLRTVPAVLRGKGAM